MDPYSAKSADHTYIYINIRVILFNSTVRFRAMFRLFCEVLEIFTTPKGIRRVEGM